MPAAGLAYVLNPDGNSVTASPSRAGRTPRCNPTCPACGRTPPASPPWACRPSARWRSHHLRGAGGGGDPGARPGGQRVSGRRRRHRGLEPGDRPVPAQLPRPGQRPPSSPARPSATWAGCRARRSSPERPAWTSALQRRRGSHDDRWPRLHGDWMVTTPLLGSFGTKDTDPDAHKVVAAITRRGSVLAYDTAPRPARPLPHPAFTTTTPTRATSSGTRWLPACRNVRSGGRRRWPSKRPAMTCCAAGPTATRWRLRRADRRAHRRPRASGGRARPRRARNRPEPCCSRRRSVTWLCAPWTSRATLDGL